MKLFFRLCIFFSFLFLIYSIWRSEIFLMGNNRDFYFAYYLISIISICFFFIVNYLDTKIQKYLLISFGSIFFILYIFEGYAFLFHKGIYVIHNNVKFDKRSKLQIYNDLKKNNDSIAMTVAPKFYININNEFLPLSGLSNSKTIHCNESGYYSIYQSDRYGFNNPDQEWNSKVVEYLLVGDSSTHGACVNRPNDIASVLRILSKKHVLNLGYSGNGPLLEYITLREYIPPSVKKILWLYSEDSDLNDLNKELESLLLNKYLKDLNFSQNLKSKQNEVNKLSLKTIESERRSANEREREKQFHNTKIIKFIKLSNIRAIWHLPSIPKSEPGPEIKKIIKLANDLANTNNSKLYFIYLPSFKRYYEKDKTNNFDKHKQNIKKIVEDLNIHFIDIDDEVFKKEVNPLSFFPFEMLGHYTVEGYKKTAFKIYEKTN